MSSRTRIGNEVSGSEQAVEQELETVEEGPELRPSVEQEIHAKVDTHHPDARPEGMTLEAEERFVAREDEIRRTRQRWDRRQTSDREARTRTVVSADTRYAREEPPQDPREQLDKEQLAEVNRHAARIADRLEGRSRAAAAYRLAREVLDGREMLEAALAVREELQATPGIPVPIAEIGAVPRSAVDIEGVVVKLWKPSHHRIQQVGLIEDESGRTRFTVWERSNQPWMSEGEYVRLRNVEKSWYEGRVSVALTGWSQMEFPGREEWWTA
jgi:hypothetical protein